MSGHQLLRIKEKLSNTPHLMHLQSFETIIDYLNSREMSEFKPDEKQPDLEATSRYSFNKDIGVAIMSIDGPTTYKPVTVMGMDCGGASYQQIKEDFTYLVDNGAKTIAFSVSSGGGEAFQMMPTAEYMRKLATDNNVKLITYVDGLSASAAYGLSCIADEIIMAPSSEVGSIGVVVRLINDSKALEMEGYERVFVAAGASKTPFAEDGSFKEDFIADLQGKVDTLYQSFTEFVAEQRGISVEAVKATEAKTFLPERAIELGLADATMTLEAFYSHLADVAQNENPMLKNKLFGMNKEGQSFDMNELELTKSELSELGTKYEAQAADLQLALAGVQDLQAKLAEAQGVVAEFQAAKAQAEMEAKQAVAQSRKAALVASIGEEKAVALSASLEGVSDAQYEAVVAAVTAANAALVENPLFKEMGADVEVETNPDMEDALAKLIQKTYKTK